MMRGLAEAVELTQSIIMVQQQGGSGYLSDLRPYFDHVRQKFCRR
jgi:hypothetical protein